MCDAMPSRQLPAEVRRAEILGEDAARGPRGDDLTRRVESPTASALCPPQAFPVIGEVCDRWEGECRWRPPELGRYVTVLLVPALFW